MKPWTSWLAQVGLVGACLTAAGCGGGSGPEAASDTSATTPAATSAAPDMAQPTASTDDAGAAPAAEPAPAVTSAAPDAAAGAKSDEIAVSGSATEEQPAAKPEGASATNEMLALATGPAPAAAGSDRPGAAANGAPGSSMAPSSAMGMAPSAGAGPASSTPIEMPSSGMGNEPVGLSADVAMNINETPMEIAGGSAGGGLNPTLFKNPFTAANAFLTALQKKNPDWLAQATALRATTEASPKYQKVFTAILEQSLAPEDLDELAKKFDGMKIMGNNTPKSTGKFEIIVGKMATNGSSFHRTITLRKEKAGWKVVDISGVREFEKPIIMPRGGMGGMGGHHHR